MESGVYRIVNKIDGKIYVGSAKNTTKRKSEHFWCLRNRRHCNVYLQRAYNKHGEDAFIFEIIELCDEVDCVEREQYYIDLYKPYERQSGYNICENAASILGIKRSDETKKKIGSANSGKKLSKEQKEHLSTINKGKKLSKEHKEKIRSGNLGKSMSGEAKQKISAGNKGKSKSIDHRKSMSEAQRLSGLNGVKIAQFDLNGNLIKIHDKAIRASEEVGFAYGNLFQHLKGKRPHIKGFIFKYHKEEIA